MPRRTRSKGAKPTAASADTAPARSAEKVDLRAHALAPDLEAIRRFIVDMLARRAIVELISSVLALLQRMREINTELMSRIAAKSRKRPPSETLRRLQMELPLMFAVPANDTSETEREGPPEPPPMMVPPLDRSASTEEKPAKKNRHDHGRTKFPSWLLRIFGVRAYVSAEKRICPTCKRRAKTLGFKKSEKLTVRPCEYVVEQDEVETCACGKCHAYIVTAQKPKEVVPRGVLGNELLVQALVDHYDNAVPWEQMERTARQQDVPLSANTLAASVGAAIDHFEPVIEHIKEQSLSSEYTALDATSIKVLDDEHALGVRTGSLWLI